MNFQTANISTGTYVKTATVCLRRKNSDLERVPNALFSVFFIGSQTCSLVNIVNGICLKGSGTLSVSTDFPKGINLVQQPFPNIYGYTLPSCQVTTAPGGRFIIITPLYYRQEWGIMTSQIHSSSLETPFLFCFFLFHFSFISFFFYNWGTEKYFVHCEIQDLKCTLW